MTEDDLELFDQFDEVGELIIDAAFLDTPSKELRRRGCGNRCHNNAE